MELHEGQLMVHHSFHRQVSFEDALQVPYILPHRTVLPQNIEENKTLRSELGKEAYKEI